MENQELFKQAILDAKAVRETAMAAARTTLAEHFEPFIKETMAKELQKEDEAVEETVEMEEDMDMEAKMHGETKMHDEAAHTMDEATLDEILAELDALSEDMEKGDLEEGHVKSDGYDGKAAKGETGYDEKAHTSKGGTGYPEKAKSSIHEAEDDEKEEEDDEAEEAGEDLTKDIEAGEGGDEQEVVDITVGDLKDIIRDVFMQLQGGAMAPEAPLDADTDLAADLGGEKEKEISLDEILAELELEEDKMENEAKEMKKEAAEAGEIPGGEIDPHAGDVYKVKEDLKEAVKTIESLRTELNEINLFSAKLLYVNKIFKAKNLNEAQKTKVINAFDRATSVKEVENTYATLLESLTAESKKTTIKESVGFASKPIGNAPARPIVEADAFVSRWQKLAGIK